MIGALMNSAAADIGKWSTDLRAMLPKALTILLLLTIALDVGHFAYAAYEAHEARPSARASPEPNASAMRRGQELLQTQAILRAHLFGRAESPAGQAGSGSAPLLDLLGVLSTERPGEGYAIIRIKGGQAQLCHTGGAICAAPPWTLQQVFPSYVIVLRDGRPEILRLPASRLAQSVIAAPTLASSSEASEPATTRVPGELPPSAAQSAIGPLQGDIEGLSQDGLMIHPIKAYQRQYGLKDGDRVIAINGMPITSSDDLAQALSGASRSLQILVQNASGTQSLQLPVP